MNSRDQGMIFGLMGVLVFSASLPATRAAVGGFDPWFLTGARASIAALIGMWPLLLTRQPLPRLKDLGGLALAGCCVVVGFPLLSSMAMQHMTAVHGLLFSALLPLATATFGVLRGGERPRPAFWIFALSGSAVVAGFAIIVNGSGGGSVIGSALMLAAVTVCGLGYAEGARLSRQLGGWQVICWALLLMSPFMLALSVFAMPATFIGIAAPAWVGLGYVSLFSMLIGFFFWYHGLALGGTASVGQLQLLQPLLGLVVAGQLLHEAVSSVVVLAIIGVLVCVAGARRFA